MGRWAIPAWIAAGVAVLLAADLLVFTPDLREIGKLGEMARATTLYDAHGATAFTVFKERRIQVPLDQISPDLINAVLATEDARFYRHWGLDVWRIGGAMLANLRNGDAVQGGSTITQQLARKTYFSDEKTLRRKLKEAVVALRIEHRFSKREILEFYLNKIYFGEGLYGVEAAARGYFDKSAKSLTLAEAATLAGLIKAPSKYTPTDAKPLALARRSVVLRRMTDAGFIDANAAAAADKAPLEVRNGFKDDDETGQYFKNYVTRLLVDRFGWQTVASGGLKVYTTYDPKAQHAAEAAVARGLADIEKTASFVGARRREIAKRGKTGAPSPATPASAAQARLQAAIVAIDPTSGEVRALVGGRDFKRSQFDRVTQAHRQAGSAFKPFVYAAALEMGASPATLLDDLDDPTMTPQGAWLPADGHSGAGAMTVRTAIRTSSNRAAVQMLRTVGISNAVNYAARVGLEAPAVPSLALGAGDVTLLSLTSAYGVFANGGWLKPPVVITRVEDRTGKLLFADHPAASQAITEQNAFLMAQMLTDVVDRGTGYRARQVGFRLPAAGKTGTTNDYRDAWFVGFTPALVAGVWVGFDQPTSIMPGGYAAELAAPIWGRFMKAATAGEKPAWLRPPPGIIAVQVCRISGKLPGEGCHHVETIDADGDSVEKDQVGVEYFRAGTEPTEECDLHAYTGGFLGRLMRIIR
ncbi:MAG TPA: PBP1A family penicillin-binding protein [Vicinamibacterales bacterium]|nr:PBP1A family penicillin-binding protein [Vicinamibacterales bacterium]